VDAAANPVADVHLVRSSVDDGRPVAGVRDQISNTFRGVVPEEPDGHVGIPFGERDGADRRGLGAVAVAGAGVEAVVARARRRVGVEAALEDEDVVDLAVVLEHEQGANRRTVSEVVVNDDGAVVVDARGPEALLEVLPLRQDERTSAAVGEDRERILGQLSAPVHEDRAGNVPCFVGRLVVFGGPVGQVQDHERVAALRAQLVEPSDVDERAARGGGEASRIDGVAGGRGLAAGVSAGRDPSEEEEG